MAAALCEGCGCRASGGFNAVFAGKEMANGGRRGGGKLLPAEKLQPAAEIAGMHGPEHRKPSFHEVSAAAVKDDGEAAIKGMGGENTT